MNIESVITAAAGREPADTLFINCKVVNVFTGEILNQNVAVKDGYICGFETSAVSGSGSGASAGSSDICRYNAKEVIDLEDRYLAPGFIDAHVHIESSMVTPARFSRGVVPFGTTTVVADPHEIANVMGVDGIKFMIKSAENAPMNILFSLPSCVPATDMETAGARLEASDLEPLLSNEKIAALAEMMNYPGVIFTEPSVMEKIKAAKAAGKTVDGHAPAVTGKELNAYVSAGIYSDHECTTPAEAVEKLRLGMHIMVREGTCAKNLEDLLPAVNDNTWQHMMWCTDDRHPDEILNQGHIDHIVRKAVLSGIEPVRAIQMATLNCARYFGIKNIGAIAPGRRADMITFRDISNPIIEKVFVSGKLVAERGVLIEKEELTERPSTSPVMNFDLDEIDFLIPCPPDRSQVRVIRAIPHQVVTKECIMDVLKKDGYAESDTERDMLKIAVIERYSGKGNMSTGFVTGLGITKGAIASTVAHDSHNIIVAGADDGDMLVAIKALKEMGGGFIVVCEGEVTAKLPLPVAGLMSDSTLEAVNDSMSSVLRAVRAIGSRLSDPFMTLGFLALPVIPSLKITDRGLIDVEKFQIVELFV